MIEIYKKHNNIIIIDAHEYIPYDVSYFSNATLALHPNSKGHELYGDKLINDLKRIIGNVTIKDDKEEARRCIS